MTSRYGGGIAQIEANPLVADAVEVGNLFCTGVSDKIGIQNGIASEIGPSINFSSFCRHMIWVSGLL